MVTKTTTTKEKEQTDIIKDGIISMEKLLRDTNIPLKIYKEGDKVEAKIKRITKNKIFATVDDRINGIIGGKELLFDPQFVRGLNTGDTISAYVVFLEDDEGNMLLSLRKAGRENIWANFQKKHEDKETISVVVTDANKGGLIIEMGGVKGFLPVSQLSADNYPRVEGGDKSEILERLNKMVGKAIDVKILSIDRSSNKLIFSEREAIGNRDVPKGIKVGDEVEGKVTGIVDFGFFVEVNGVEGLVHISEISWGKVEDVKDFVKVGDKLKLKIIDIENSRLSLSMKRLETDPWKKLVEGLEVGSIIKGKVNKITPFGAFVKIKLDGGGEIDALVHISEISSKHLTDPKEILKVGEEKNFKILTIEPEQHRLSLSLKALEEGAKKEEVEKEDSKEEKKPSAMKDSKETKSSALESLGGGIVKKLAKAGIKKITDLKKKKKEDLVEIEGIGEKTAEKIIDLTK